MYSNIVTCTQLLNEPGIAVLNAGFWAGHNFQDYFPTSNADTEYFDDFHGEAYPCYFMNMNWFEVNVRASDPGNKISNNTIPLADCDFCWPDRSHPETVTQFIWLQDLLNLRKVVYGFTWYQRQRPNILPTLVEGRTRFLPDDNETFWKIQVLGQEYPYPSGAGAKVDVVFTQFRKNFGQFQTVDRLFASFGQLQASGGPYYQQYGKGIRIPAKVVLTNDLITSENNIPPPDLPIIDVPGDDGNIPATDPVTDPVDSGSNPVTDPVTDPVGSGSGDNPIPDGTTTTTDSSGNTTTITSSTNTDGVTTKEVVIIKEKTKEKNVGWLVLAGAALAAILLSK